jgi:EAL domain-containing protein (putative c-di-GMP-specific phosphodiesterase class I)
MGKKTVAEFVTDQEMTDRLRQSGIDYAQGFHIGKPLPVTELPLAPTRPVLVSSNVSLHRRQGGRTVH